MRTLGFTGLAFASLVAIVACSSAGNSNDAQAGAGGGFGAASGTGGSAGGSGSGGAGAYGGGGGYGGGAGSSGAAGGSYGSGGSGGSGGNAGAAGAGGAAGTPGADAGADAGDAAVDACAALDQSKSAVFYLSADDSNSMGSPSIVRSRLQKGMPVWPGLIRTHEFLNYYNVGYPAASVGNLAIVPEMRVGTEPGTLELQIGVASPSAVKPRRPMVLTFVLDTSGSMSGPPIQRQADVVHTISKQMTVGDIVSVVTWNTSQAVPLDAHVVSGPSDAKLASVINALTAGGGTDLSGGLSKGYAIAQKHFDSVKLNRVVLVSDGMANVGVTDENTIGAGAMLNDGDGIYLVGVGVGEGVNDTLMNKVTDLGRGAYVYIDSAGEAQKMFGPRFDEVMDVAARAVQVELRMPWYMGIEKFFGEEYSTNPQEIEPQHLAPDDAMVFTQFLKACSSEKLDLADEVEVTARWSTPITHVAKEYSVKVSLGSLLSAPPKYLPKGLAIIAFAEAFKDSQNVKAGLAEAKKLVLAADPAGTDPELKEISLLIDKALTVY